MPSWRAASERLPPARSSARSDHAASRARATASRSVTSLVVGVGARGARARSRTGSGRFGDVDDLAAAQHGGALEHVDQLAHVARPAIGEQVRHRLLGDGARRRAARARARPGAGCRCARARSGGTSISMTARR